MDQNKPKNGIPFNVVFTTISRSSDKLSNLYFVFLIIMGVIEILLNNVLGMFPSDMYLFFTQNKMEDFKYSLIKFSIMVLVISLVITIRIWITDRLSICYRNNLVLNIQDNYLRDNSFHDLLIQDTSIDNPDARITQDVESWSNDCGIVLGKLSRMPFIIVYYFFLSYQLLGTLSVLICIAFSVLSMIITYFTMIPVARITYSYEAAQGSYRLSHTNMKENAELICLSNSQIMEQRLLSQKLDDVLLLQKSLANHSIPLNWVSTFFSYFGGLMEYICIFFFVFQKMSNKSPSEIASFTSKAGFIVISFISGLCMILNVVQEISKLIGYGARINELCMILQEHKDIVQISKNSEKIELQNVTITRPTGEVLLSNLSFVVDQGDSLFITGPSGCGKSSIFRVLGRIWPTTSGIIASPTPSPNLIMVLTQNPYIPHCGIHECFTFPIPPQDTDLSVLYDIIHRLELQHLLRRSSDTWMMGLSPGEKQRIALVRLLLHKPRFVLLDEATSAIPEKLEKRIFHWINESNITTITISHNIKLRRFHRMSLDIEEVDKFNYYKN